MALLRLGKLDGSTQTLPNPGLFVHMYVRKEAVLSSQIEGTQSTLLDLLSFEAVGGKRKGFPRDVTDVANYVEALGIGLDRVKNGAPITLDLLKKIHAILLRGSPGTRYHGRFRDHQNFIGPDHSDISTAEFVPPNVRDMTASLEDLERFINSNTALPLLVKVGIAHAQFETIHPFVDGNGRIGRMLITLMLMREGAISQPLLYLSYFLKKRRDEYWHRLQAIRDDGDWEGWLMFYMRGIAEVSEQATATAKSILRLIEQDRAVVERVFGGKAGRALLLLESLYIQPYVSVRDAMRATGYAFPAANDLVREMAKHGMLEEMTGQRRYRLFSYGTYVRLLSGLDG